MRSRPDSRAGRARLSGAAEPGPARGGAARRGRGGGAAAGDRRGRQRQDRDAGAPGGAPDRRRGRPAAHPADDLLAPGGGRDGAADRADRRRGAGRAGRGAGRGADLVGDVPCDRRAGAARACGGDRARSRVHAARPQRFRRPDEPGAASAGPVEDREPVSGQGHLPRDLQPGGERARGAGAAAGGAVSLVSRLGGGAARAVRRLCRGEAGGAGARLRRPAALLGRDDGRPGHGGRAWGRASIMCWSTSIRTPTGCRRRSSRR